MYYVTMQITLPIPEFTRNERNFHCDVLHISSVLPRVELAFSFKHINTFDSDLRPHQSHFNDK